jgi:hypothetical protein
MVAEPPDPSEYVDSQFSGSSNDPESVDFEAEKDSLGRDQQSTTSQTNSPDLPSSGEELSSPLLRGFLFYILSVTVILSLSYIQSVSLVTGIPVAVIGGAIPPIIIYLSPLKCIPSSKNKES